MPQEIHEYILKISLLYSTKIFNHFPYFVNYKKMGSSNVTLICIEIYKCIGLSHTNKI